MSELQLDLQKVCAGSVPATADFKRWAAAALRLAAGAGGAAAAQSSSRSLCIRLVDEAESAELNERYRDKAGATNVLSFVAEAPPGLPVTEADALLGDVVICAPLVAHEAAAERKQLTAHWALLTVHGVLHLLGYDHQNDADWATMTNLESAILKATGLPDPWASHTEQAPQI